MNYKQLYPEEFEEVTINWSQPFDLDSLQAKKVANHEKGYFYKLLGKRNYKFELFYIGQTQSQYVSQRLINGDHKIKQEKFRKDHPKHRLYVSIGRIESPNNIKETLVNNVERLLIYSSFNNDHRYFKNKSNTLTHKAIKSYRIINKGFKQDKMSKEIAYGLFLK
jgi:hypothetical protein